MEEKTKQFAILLLVLLGSCSSTPPAPSNITLSELGEYYWDNDSLTSNISLEKKNFELTKAKASCKVQKLSVQIPAPSCVQPPRRDCSGLQGFALGFCRSYRPQPSCDYSAVNAAKEAQEEIWSACMTAEGWTLSFSSEGFGSDTSGGLYSPAIANNGTNQWYVKLDSIKTSDRGASALVRSECVPGIQCKRSQYLWIIDYENRTVAVEQEEPITYIETDAASFIAGFLKNHSLNLASP